jgi:hypothetical protein
VENDIETLGPAGRALHDSIAADTEAAGLELDPKERILLFRAARVADTIAALEDLVAAEGYGATGSTGQRTIHSGVAEIRLQHTLLQSLLKGIAIDSEVETLASQRARQAATRRWQGQDAIARRRG